MPDDAAAVCVGPHRVLHRTPGLAAASYPTCKTLSRTRVGIDPGSGGKAGVSRIVHSEAGLGGEDEG
jgi:hypothetical protein